MDLPGEAVKAIQVAPRQGPLNIARWLPRSAANGPGERFVLWLQGCPLKCPGCWNPDTWSFAERLAMSSDEILSIIRGTSGLEGLTLTGGEPLAQAEGLLPLVQGARRAGLSVMIFTGYEVTELQTPAIRAVLAHTDILIAGRFRLAERSLDLAWQGSRNQRVIFLSERYSPRDIPATPDVEFHLDAEGRLAVTGFPGAELLSALALDRQD